jgi:hypothetical protein
LFFFPSLLATENLQNQFFFLIFNFAFWRNFASKKKRCFWLPLSFSRSEAREADAPVIFHKSWQAENPEFLLCHTWQTSACHCGSPFRAAHELWRSVLALCPRLARVSPFTFVLTCLSSIAMGTKRNLMGIVWELDENKRILMGTRGI